MPDKDKKKGVIKANYELQGRIGKGPLDKQVIEKCEEVMQSNEIDFKPMAMDYLNQLSAVMQDAKSGKFDNKAVAVKAIIAPVMQLKANGKTFGYELIGSMANIMLSFMESIEEVDGTVLEIIDAHHKTLYAIVMKEMKGDGGASGRELEDELKSVCKRYLSKVDKDKSA